MWAVHVQRASNASVDGRGSQRAAPLRRLAEKTQLRRLNCVFADSGCWWWWDDAARACKKMPLLFNGFMIDDGNAQWG